MKSSIIHLSDGLVQGVGDETLELIAGTIGHEVNRRRASHVLPRHPVKRLVFRILRAVFGERGRIATWCRSWNGPWQVSWAHEPHRVVFSHSSRRVCIEWEIEQLNARLGSQI